ncbi:MAG TPA: energy transducer TonB [Bryobacteraceae bacterium]|nr:energy transducer TonB [Bryobacteraceae bacterium]
MRVALTGLACLWAAVLLSAQTATLRPEVQPPEDPKLRAEAVGLLERANRVSTPAVWPPNEMTLRFRVPEPAPGEAAEGEYISSFGGPGLRRQEWHYGEYQPVQIRNGRRISVTRNNSPKPAVLELLPKLTPIYLGRFDQQDVIRSIRNGPADTRCVEFESVFGDRMQPGEICVAAREGWLLSIRQGDEVTKNANFLAFAGAFLPGHIERWEAGRKVIEIEETVVPKSDYPPDFFSVPETATGFICQNFRRAYAENAPQPEPGGSPNVRDVRLLGLIGTDGHVSNLKAIEQLEPELNGEAIKLVSGWTFSPATCDGMPAAWETVFTVHFKGR